ncbi:hypothetical protein CCR97_10185 [Rhodoplanes elegans]|uniref:Tape measure protein N-terminal domain-containing protein n=1 Tax=Rhodoplanes elegans TaxID=29408 RepID=A0A327KS51_9BRAD|nr:tape measure protein [Rhodoplanes elegans]MBK5958574.1 hypothetical protein [Rhodoplanes elegans]RAI40533.1 hypothetical protein CH338_05975 [Rhodoplanes elegans]
MAESVQVARLVASFEANSRKFDQSIRKIEADSRRTAALLKQHLGAGGRLTEGLDASFAKSARAAEASLAKVSGSALGAEASLVALRRGFVLLAGAVSVQQVGQLADQYTTLQNALKISGLEGDSLSKVYRQLYESAQSNAVPIEALVKLYGRVSSAQKELHASSSELIKLTDAVALALKVAGTDATEASGALLQLGQALAGGKVQAEEYNSLLDGARPILQAAAAGLKEAGGSVGELTKLVKDGKVSSEAFFRAILAGVPVLEQAAKSADPTLSSAWVKLKNRMVDAAGATDSATGATKALVQIMEGLGRAMDKVSGRSWVDNIDGFRDSVRAVEITKELIELEKQLAAAGALAGQTKLRGDYAMAQTLQTRINSLNDEFNRIKDRGLKATMSPPVEPTTKPPVTIPPDKQVSIEKFPVKEDKDKGGADTNAFERAVAQTQKHIAVMTAENAVIGQNAEARERARTVAMLETAAKEANAEAGMKNTAVTEAQRAKINEVADAMEKAAQRERLLTEAFMRIDRAADTAADAFTSYVTGSQTASQAFKNFADSVISDLIRMEAKASIMNLFGYGSAGSSGGSILSGLKSFLGFAGGGLVQGAGTATSDSIPARLSAGEFVVRAEATRRTLPLLHAINESGGRVPRFASGGLVGDFMAAGDRAVMASLDGASRAPPALAKLSQGTPIAVNVVVNNNASAAVKTESRRNSDGGLDLEVIIDQAQARNIGRPGSATDAALATRNRLVRR